MPPPATPRVTRKPRRSSTLPLRLPDPQRMAAQSCEVQFGQRLAGMGMAVQQKGHSFVVGAAAGAGASRFILFMPRITRKIAKATIRKLMMVLTNTPTFTVTAPAALASASEAYGPAAFVPSLSVRKRFE